MNKIQRIHFFEVSLYAIVLITALCVPFFSGIFTNAGIKAVLTDWVRLSPFVAVFLINNYLLVPKLLFKEKYPIYFLTCILMVIAVVYLSDLLFDLTRSVRAPFDHMHDSGPPPDKMFPPAGRPPRHDGFGPNKPLHHGFNFGLAIVSFLLIGFNTGIKSFVRWNEERVRQAERERHYLYTELAFLKHQISPHFLMNTLNNIHALIDIDTEEAKDAVIKLSRLMRYLLYEADIQKVSLKKEVEFIESYIELMRLRYDENTLTVETEYPADTEAITVPSFLFLSFIENAFKYGVDLHVHSLIQIRFVRENDRLVFTVRNNKSGIVFDMGEASGIGLENVRKRLDLIYKNDYILEIRSSDDAYEIYLKIPV